MGKSKETFGKKEKEKKRREKQAAKAERKEARQANSDKGKDLMDMLVYVDENGNLSTTPADPKKVKKIKAENIQIAVLKEEDRPVEDTVKKGTVSFFNETKGFGFIKDKETGRDVFVHINSLSKALKENESVTYEIGMGKKGPEAINVKVL